MTDDATETPSLPDALERVLHETETLAAEAGARDREALPYVLTPRSRPTRLLKCARADGPALDRLLAEVGAVLLRGFEVDGPSDFEAFIEATSGAPMEYRDRATPRSRVTRNIFTATDYPPDVSIFLHNESAFAARFPGRIFFYCRQPSGEGGETPIADVHRVWNELPPALRDRFAERRVLYARSFGRGFGLAWQSVFQTDDRDEMEAYCRDAEIEVEWIGEDRLRARQVRPAVASHPGSGVSLWFNHVATLHVSTLAPAKRKMLAKLFKEGDLPNNVYYGDGSAIDDADVETIRAAYLRCTRTFPWQAGDVLAVDNLRVAHGRRPFRGRREVLVGMARPLGWNDVAR